MQGIKISAVEYVTRLSVAQAQVFKDILNGTVTSVANCDALLPMLD